MCQKLGVSRSRLVTIGKCSHYRRCLLIVGIGCRSRHRQMVWVRLAKGCFWLVVCRRFLSWIHHILLIKSYLLEARIRCVVYHQWIRRYWSDKNSWIHLLGVHLLILWIQESRLWIWVVHFLLILRARFCFFRKSGYPVTSNPFFAQSPKSVVAVALVLIDQYAVMFEQALELRSVKQVAGLFIFNSCNLWWNKICLLVLCDLVGSWASWSKVSLLLFSRAWSCFCVWTGRVSGWSSFYLVVRLLEVRSRLSVTEVTERIIFVASVVGCWFTDCPFVFKSSLWSSALSPNLPVCEIASCACYSDW